MGFEGVAFGFILSDDEFGLGVLEFGLEGIDALGDFGAPHLSGDADHGEGQGIEAVAEAASQEAESEDDVEGADDLWCGGVGRDLGREVIFEHG